MNLPFVLLIDPLFASWLVASLLPSRSCYRRDFDGYEGLRRVRLELNLMSKVSHEGPGLNVISRWGNEMVSRSHFCRPNLVPRLAIDRFCHYGKPFPIQPAVEMQYASS
jgi:hypothetical protein